MPGYRIYRKGKLTEQPRDIRSVWRDDLVAFLLGCSFTFEHALVEAGVPLRNVERDTMVPMFVSNIPCAPGLAASMGRWCPCVPLPKRRSTSSVNCQPATRTPTAHPSTLGTREAIGISDLTRPDYGEPV